VAAELGKWSTIDSGPIVHGWQGPRDQQDRDRPEASFDFARDGKVVEFRTHHDATESMMQLGLVTPM